MNILILGGNRFFGLHLAKQLLHEGHQITLLNRGQGDDGLGHQIERIQVDRRERKKLEKAVDGKKWDIVFDQICYTPTEENHSPYGGDKTKTMNTDLLASIGFKAIPSAQFIEQLVFDTEKTTGH